MLTMNTYKLKKRIRLYKPQFDLFNQTRTGNHEIDRTSLELDAILFRVKYMVKKGYDVPDIYGDEFTQKSIRLQQLFGEFMYDFLAQVVTIPKEFHLDDIMDVLSKNVHMNSKYVSFDMILISTNKEYLKFVDNAIGEDYVYNMFPENYFRYNTDSYNDAIAKAFPELFESKHQDIIGTGADGDVFVHNLTFQTTERCSLNCFAAGTMITMADGSMKKIEDVQVGDVVLGIPEDIKDFKYPRGYCDHPYHCIDNYVPSKVTRTYVNTAETISVWYEYGGEHEEMFRVTSDHPFLTCGGEFMSIPEIIEKEESYIHVSRDDRSRNGYVSTQMSYYELEINPGRVETVYNLETETHTYIANDSVVHNCTYCYQFNKSPMRMEFDTAKKFIDHLLNDDYGYINRYNSPAIIIEFIGGEPLLEIKLTRRIYEYFLDRCYKLNHPWFTMHRVSICSNGLQYFDGDVQQFFRDYASNISFNISIDGNKKLHDSCRIQPNGEGSYDIAMAALNHFNAHYTSERNSKMTLAPSNIKYLFESVKDFIDNNMTCINLNCVFEEGWTRETARIEYEQLKLLADYLIENDLENVYIALFTDRQEGMQDPSNDGPSWGGSGSLTAVRPTGPLYPCIRYMPTSVGDNVPDLCMGTVDDGWNERSDGSEVIKLLDSCTRRASSNDICFSCPISNNCPNCSALAHALYGTPNKRTTFHCIQHIAEALANVYYWNKLALAHPEWNLPPRVNVVPDEWSLLIIDKDELNILAYLEKQVKGEK